VVMGLSGFLSKNLEFLKKRYPDLAEFVFVGEATGSCCRVISARLSGKPSLRFRVDRRELSVHSPYDPEGEARRWVQGLDLEGIRYLGVYGLGLGYHVQELVRQWPGLEKIVIVEPSQEIFAIACKAVDFQQFLASDKVALAVFPDRVGDESKTDSLGLEKKLEKCLAPLFHIGQLDALHFVEFGPYVRLFPEFYELLKKAFATLGRSVRINENTILFFSRMWPQNVFANLVDTVKSSGVASLFGEFEGCPGIIISAGPSLNKNKHLLKEAKGRAVLICVGTALRALLKDGIVPDLVVTIDGGEANYRHFADFDPGDVPLVFVPTAHYRILEEYPGRKFVIGGGNELIDWICQFTEPKGLLNWGGSVAHAAFDLALRMGCEPVVLVGQDLAFTGGETHARGTVYEGRKAEEGKKKFYVEDVYGGKVLTDSVLNDFRRWFENALSTFAGDRLVIDATEGGAKIAGTVIMTLQDVFEQYCQQFFPVAEKIRSSLEAPVPFAETGSRLLDALEDALSSLEDLENVARRGLRLARSLGLEYEKTCPDERVVRKLLKRLDKVDKELKNAEADTFLNLILQPLLLVVTKGPLARADSEESERDFAKRISARSALLYDGIKEASRRMQEYMKKARDDLEAALACCEAKEECRSTNKMRGIG